MNVLKEAQVAVDFATYYPMLYKATADSDSTIPGYICEEIIKLSYVSVQHRTLLVDFLLGRLQSCNRFGRQKIIQIFFFLCRRGHFGFRVLLRQRDGHIRSALSLGMPPDPLISTAQQMLRDSGKELVSLLFDPDVVKEDEEKAICGDDDKLCQIVPTGYGVNWNKDDSAGHPQRRESLHKYEGFGNVIPKQEGIAQQMLGVVGKMLQSVDERPKVGFSGDEGNYSPLPSSSFTTSMASSSFGPFGTSVMAGSLMSISYRGSKGYVAGKAGGGWASDEDDGASSLLDFSPNRNDPSLSNTPNISCSPVPSSKMSDLTKFLEEVFASLDKWPADFDKLVSLVQRTEEFDQHELLRFLAVEMEKISTQINKSNVNPKIEVQNLPIKVNESNREIIKNSPNKNGKSEDKIKLKSERETEMDNDETSSSLSDDLSSSNIKSTGNFDTNKELNLSYECKMQHLVLILLLIEFGLNLFKFSPEAIRQCCADSLKRVVTNNHITSRSTTKAMKLVLLIGVSDEESVT